MSYADPPPIPLGIDTSLEETNEALIFLNLTWDSNFNSDYAITSYIIAPETTAMGNPVLTCPHSCYPDNPCQCNGIVREDHVNITISAVNCRNQEGTSITIIVASCMKMHVWIHCAVILAIAEYTLILPSVKKPGSGRKDGSGPSRYFLGEHISGVGVDTSYWSWAY